VVAIAFYLLVWFSVVRPLLIVLLKEIFLKSTIILIKNFATANVCKNVHAQKLNFVVTTDENFAIETRENF